jgi:hypothetical protein
VSKLEELIAEEKRCEANVQEAKRAREEARAAVLAERFKGWERYNEGDIVLVPRKLFGKIKMWPAKIVDVNLHYSSGNYPKTYRDGEAWSHQTITYKVMLQKDGEFPTSGGHEVVYHQDVQPAHESIA